MVGQTVPENAVAKRHAGQLRGTKIDPAGRSPLRLRELVCGVAVQSLLRTPCTRAVAFLPTADGDVHTVGALCGDSAV